MKFYTSAERVGDNILHRYIEVLDGKQQKIVESLKYKPTLYVPTEYESKALYTDLQGNYLQPLPPFESMKEAGEYARELKESQVDVYGQPRFQYAFLDDNYPGSEGVQADTSHVEVFFVDIESECEYGFPDPAHAPEPVNAITVYSKLKDQYIVLSTLEYSKHMEGVHFLQCTSESDLLSRFVTLMKECQPEVITGWNVRFFDVPYLVNRIKNVLGNKAANSLSPFNRLRQKNVEVFNKEQMTYEIFGVAVLDYLELYKKFKQNLQESYKLDYIAQVELGEQKIDYSEYGTALHHLYKANTQVFIEYNIHDVTLVKRLEDKLGFIELAMLIAYRSKVNYNDVFTQVAMWDALTVNYLKNTKGALCPFYPNVGDKNKQFTGAYVRTPKRGLYEWVVSFDLASLYPSIIMALNISPDKFVNKLPNIDIERFVSDYVYADEIRKTAVSQNSAIAANGAMFTHEGGAGFLPEILDKMYAERKAQKKVMLRAKTLAEATKKYNGDGPGIDIEKYSVLDTESVLEDCTKEQLEYIKEEAGKIEVLYDAMQQATKINLNSCFGVLGNPYFRWFDVDQAEAITITGQLAIKWISKRIDEFVSKVLGEDIEVSVYGDTDSVYVDFSPIVEKYWHDRESHEVVDALDKLCNEKVEPYIKGKYEELEDYINAYSRRFDMDRENIGPAAFFQKKRYIMHVYDSEGVRYAEPKMKVMGMESVRSTTPKYFRDKLQESYELILTTTSEKQLQEKISDVKEDFHTLSFEEFARPTGVNGIIKRQGDLNQKGLPIQVKASMVYNKLIDDLGLNNEREKITDGDKIKFVYLKEPNPVQSHAVAFVDELPKEFGLHAYVDSERMFDDCYLSPMERTIKTFGWDITPKVNLMDMMDEEDESPKSYKPSATVKQEIPREPSGRVSLDDFMN